MARDSFYPQENPFKKKDKKKEEDKPYKGKETLGEEMLEHDVILEEPLESHKGEETPEEEAAEEAEIAAITGKDDGLNEVPDPTATVSMGELRSELKDLLARLGTPAPKSPRNWSLNEKKLPL